jgi:hypothetical protein
MGRRPNPRPDARVVIRYLRLLDDGMYPKRAAERLGLSPYEAKLIRQRHRLTPTLDEGGVCELGECQPLDR